MGKGKSKEELLQLVWFHGEKRSKSKRMCDFTMRRPSSERPIWASSRWSNATDYGNDRLYVLFLNPNAKVFDFRTDILKLSGKTYFSDETLRLMDAIYRKNLNLWEVEHDVSIKRTAREKIKRASKDLPNDLRNTLLDVLADLSNTFNHNFPNDGKISRELIQNCKELSEFLPSDKILRQSSSEQSDLMVRMFIETIKAIALGKYPLDVIAYRKVLIDAASAMGFSAIIDTDTDGNSGLEVGITRIEVIDKISNIPMKTSELRTIVNGNAEVTRDEFLKFI